ncbi:hypothetical protein DFH08DRAFT_826057 [Mycena albidolilacea]|uniref:Uncharacterized protein n=1 Tax=Mycena albidolilacea TaxID=1033008 RepID=A0AAD6Z1H8_9AGAR|nr:hypothetical protein DFH08DRAFT_826057 [Mycena albidolilacea]
MDDGWKDQEQEQEQVHLATKYDAVTPTSAIVPASGHQLSLKTLVTRGFGLRRGLWKPLVLIRHQHYGHSCTAAAEKPNNDVKMMHIMIAPNREFVQKPHEPHAAFAHCAKPHDKPRVL